MVARGRALFTWAAGIGLALSSSLAFSEETAPTIEGEEVIVDESGLPYLADDGACDAFPCEEVIDCCGEKPGFFAKFKGHLAGLRLPSHAHACMADPCAPRHSLWPWKFFGHKECVCTDVCYDECVDVCGENCMIDDEIVIDGPVESTAETCPTCGHHIAPSPATPKPVATAPTTPALRGSLRLDPMDTTSDIPSLPREEPPTQEAEELVPIPKTKTIAPMSATVAPAPPIHAKDFSWIEGELQRVHVKGGAWIVRYLPLDQTDENGGSVVLLDERRLAGYREGDIVRIEGDISPARTGLPLGGPQYRLRKIVRKGSEVQPAR